MPGRDAGPPAHVGPLLRESFGGLAVELDDGTWAIQVPGLRAPVVVTANGCGDSDLLQIYTVIPQEIDWRCRGVSDFLLRENRHLAYGRFLRYDDAIALEYNLFSDGVTAEQLSAVVMATALSATAVQVPLRAMGAFSAADAMRF